MGASAKKMISNSKKVMQSWFGWRGALASLLLFAPGFQVGAVSFQDYFTNREAILITPGTLLGNNATASFELGEPNHGGKPGGHSLWVSWVAPTNGVATFDTHGSSFDTLLSAYTLNGTNATSVTQLHEEARNDDDPRSPPTSLIQFGAIAGREYEIAVDGYQGATGAVALHWSLIPSTTPPPIIVSTPNDHAARQGDQVVLSVDMTTTSNMEFAWFFSKETQPVGSGPSYTIPSLQSTNVGRYWLEIEIGSHGNQVSLSTTPVEIQINSEGATNTLAQDKLLDSSESPLFGDDGGGGSHIVPVPFPIHSPPIIRSTARAADLGVVRGYNGNQIFNTTFATTDPAEPLHCGVKGGASYWLMYEAPTNGTITMDTIGSSYDTVMEVYTFNGTLKSYADLISIACDNNSGTNGSSKVTFQTVRTRSYVVVVDGVNGARGTAWLNYVLNTNQVAQPPTLLSPQTARSVTPGSNLTLAPAVVGAQPIYYSWSKDGVVLPAGTSPFLQLTNLAFTDGGVYTLVVTNDLGTLLVVMPVHVVPPPSCSINLTCGNISLGFATVTNVLYTIDQTVDLGVPWQPWAGPFAGDGNFFSTNILGTGTRFFRLRLQ